MRTEPILALVTLTLLACNANPDPADDSATEAMAPDPIGPKLFENRLECPENDSLCWTTTLHRQGTSVQAMHFHGHGGPYLFEQRGELTPEFSALLDQTLAEVDPSKTELVDYAGFCVVASHPPYPVYLYVDEVEYEVLHQCPLEGFAALEMLVNDINQALDNCDVSWDFLTTDDCTLYPPSNPNP